MKDGIKGIPGGMKRQSGATPGCSIRPVLTDHIRDSLSASKIACRISTF